MDNTNTIIEASAPVTTEAPETVKKAAKAKKTTEAPETVTVKAKRPIRVKPGKGLYTKGDLLDVTPEEAKALVASGAAEVI